MTALGDRQAGARTGRWQLLGIPLTVAVAYALYWVIDRYRRHVNPVDFSVYRSAGHAMWGDALNYHHNVGGDYIGAIGMPFTYSPFAGIVLWPTTILGYWDAYAVWSVLMLCALAAVVWLVLPNDLTRRLPITLVITAVAAFSNPVSGHIAIGQINLLLLLLVIADLVRSPDSRMGRIVPPGCLIAIAGAIKLTALLFIPYFVMTRRWRMLASAMVTVVVTVAAAAIIAPSSSWSFATYGLWHLTDSVGLGMFGDAPGNVSLPGMLMSAGLSHAPATALALPVAVFGLWVASVADRRGGLLPAGLVVLLVAALVSPVSWMHHWVVLIPALVVLGCRPGLLSRSVAVGGALVLLWVPPWTGQEVIDRGDWWVLPGGVIREAIPLVALAAAGVLAWGPVRASRPRPRGAST